MAHIDADFETPLRQRPRAVVENYRLEHQEAPQPARPAPARPHFSRIDSGQLIRTLILVILCLGVAQLSHAEKARDGQEDFATARRM